MNTTRPRFELGLAARGLLEIPDVAGVHVMCNQGSLWITLDNDRRDIVLEAGESFFGTEHRRALVFAFEPSTLAMHAEVSEAAPPRAPSFSFVPRSAVA